MKQKSNNTVDIHYQQTGEASATNELGMREMQAKAYEARQKRFLLIKAPPASGKSRALMFIALDKLAHQELKQGRRSLVRIAKTINLQAGHYYIVEGQMLLLESIGERTTSSNFLPDARTRCIYENGTESDILLQTLRKNVVGGGYAITELQEETESRFFTHTYVTFYVACHIFWLQRYNFYLNSKVLIRFFLYIHIFH